MNFRTIITLACILIFLVGLDYLEAWTTPTVAAPGGNVAAPVNTGTTTQVKTGALGTGALSVTGDLGINSAAPTAWFSDTNERDYRMYVNGNNLTIHGDRNNSNSWTAADDPAALTLSAGAASTADYARFSNQVRATQYCDQSGAVCFTAASTTSFGKPTITTDALVVRVAGWNAFPTDTTKWSSGVTQLISTGLQTSMTGDVITASTSVPYDMCYLTHNLTVSRTDDANTNIGGCEVWETSNVWYLRASAQKRAATECRATCLTF